MAPAERAVRAGAGDLAAQPVASLKGVGPKLRERLAQLGLHTAQDLLFHLPFRYEDRTRLTPLGGLLPGGEALVAGTVELSQVRLGRRRSLLVQIADGTGSLLLRFFHFSAAQQAALARGARVRCYGEARPGPSALEMVHPEYVVLAAGEEVLGEPALTPVYPATSGLHQATLRRLVDQALALLSRHPDVELLPEPLRAEHGLMDITGALCTVHRPPPGAAWETIVEGRHPAQRRLATEELLAHHLSLRLLRRETEQEQAPRLMGDGRLREALRAALPFRLTAAQERVAGEIEQDLQRDHPMQRLLQGDVGSGKTVVAALAALQAAESGHQVALMAPTELLAEQHLHSLGAWLAPLEVPVLWLAGSQGPTARSAAVAALAEDRPAVAVGTHALFQDDVRFARLGLVIIDEQHRFGVHQRLSLRRKGERGGQRPHQLIMTATPIPRTLTMTAYADLDLSLLDELPPGRSAIDTVALPDSRRPDLVARIREACAGGRQAYWVCTLIEESATLEAQAAADTAQALAEALPELRVGLVHGRLPPRDKQQVMAAFKAGQLDLLVATTVIEVGVDVPNASLMIIENAERLGLAQLHQLRGRVGRGTVQSSCVLLYHRPLSDTARARLAVMRETGDGFRIAQRDLEIRGPGEVLGTRQTGLLEMRVADLGRDRDLLPRVEALADAILARHPEQAGPLVRRWLGNRVHYADV